MSEETLFEKLGVKYIEKDGIFYPLITLGGEENGADVGKYGRMWMDYIQKEYPQRYRSLVRFGELHDKATEVNEVAYELLEDIENEWLPNIELAYFCTVFKYQGSECDSCIIALDMSAYTLLTKNLVYTALTRAKKDCIIVCEHQALKRAISTNNVVKKQTFLCKMLKDIIK